MSKPDETKKLKLPVPNYELVYGSFYNFFPYPGIAKLFADRACIHPNVPLTASQFSTRICNAVNLIDNKDIKQRVQEKLWDITYLIIQHAPDSYRDYVMSHLKCPDVEHEKPKQPGELI